MTAKSPDAHIACCLVLIDGAAAGAVVVFVTVVMSTPFAAV
jgi:hypothetical protein